MIVAVNAEDIQAKPVKSNSHKGTKPQRRNGLQRLKGKCLYCGVVQLFKD